MTLVEPWFVEAFRSEYVDAYAHRDLTASRREAEYLRGESLESPVLDLCCGYGRHTLALLELGVDAFGIDLSVELLRHARTLPNAELLYGRLTRGDARRLPLLDASCGAVVVLFSSFGYFGDAGDRDVLREIARVLRPSGRVVLDLLNGTQLESSLVPTSRTERSGWTIDEARRLVDGGRRVVKDVRMTRSDGSSRAWREDVRLYSPREIEELCRSADLEPTRVDGEFDGRAWNEESPRLIAHARKRAPRR